MLKTLKNKVVRLLLAAAVLAMLLGTPTTPPSYAGDCEPVTGTNCPTNG